jgi:glycosyltransferase involved in cell wall biosynthesis
VENKHTPLVSIVMPVYNAGSFLRQTLESIFKQSFSDFELIVCDDASTDNSLDIIQQYNDPRVSIIRSPQNQGQAHQLNTGIAAATGEFIAIMHADDICMPERLEKQIHFLKQHTNIGLVGCNTGLLGDWQQYYPDSKGIWTYPADYHMARWSVLFGVPVLHSAVMFRRTEWQELNLLYDQEMVPAEDYDIWSKAIRHINIANIQETLMLYRLHDQQISVRAKDKELAAVKKIRKQMLDLFLDTANDAFKEAFYSFLYLPDLSGLSDKWFYLFNTWGKKQQFFPVEEFRKFISHRYGQYLQAQKKISLKHIFNPAVLDILGWNMYKSLLIKEPIKRMLRLS